MKQEGGYVLVSVLLVVVLLSVLGGAYVVATSFEVRQAFGRSERIQNYYHVRSGVEAARAWLEKEGILKGDKSLTTTYFEGCLKNGFEKVNSFSGTESIEITIEMENNEIIIESTGMDQTVQLTFIEKSFQGPILGVDTDGEFYFYDDDDEQWQNFNIGLSDALNTLEGIAWSGDELLIVGDRKANNPNVLTSNDLQNWHEHTISGSGFNHIVDVLWVPEQNTFYTLNHNGRIAKRVSIDDWHVPQNHQSINHPTSFAYGNSTFVVVSDQGEIKYSTNDGENWMYIFGVIGADSLQDVAFGNGVFVAVGNEGDDGDIYVSSDGQSWTFRHSVVGGEPWGLTSVTWTGERFVAVGEADTIVYSEDGYDWYRVSRDDDIYGESTFKRDFVSVISSGNMVVATGEDGSTSTSGASLVSKDGGFTWMKYDNKEVPKIINLSAVQGTFSGASSGYDIGRWE